MKIEIKLDKEYQAFNGQPEEVTQTFLELSAEELTGSIQDETPVDYGKLAGSWKPKLSKDKLVVSNSRNYAVFVEKGTGIFRTGGRHRIFPRRAKVLKADLKGGKTIYFRHSKGQPGKHMAEKGFMNYRTKIPNLFKQAIVKNSAGKGGKK